MNKDTKHTVEGIVTVIILIAVGYYIYSVMSYWFALPFNILAGMYVSVLYQKVRKINDKKSQSI